jgi:hypothetical protein
MSPQRVAVGRIFAECCIFTVGLRVLRPGSRLERCPCAFAVSSLHRSLVCALCSECGLRAVAVVKAHGAAWLVIVFVYFSSVTGCCANCHPCRQRALTPDDLWIPLRLSGLACQLYRAYQYVEERVEPEGGGGCPLPCQHIFAVGIPIPVTALPVVPCRCLCSRTARAH